MTRFACVAAVLGIATAVSPQSMMAQSKRAIPLEPIPSLDLRNARAEATTYRGRRAIRMTPSYPTPETADTLHAVAVLSGVDFDDGEIEVDVAGAPQAGAADFARGFIGLAFHVQSDARRFKAFFLRPTNGRADDQLRRNHATQYIAEPEYPWHRLRKEEPGRYESYVDLVPGEWTAIRITVRGSRAELFVNGAKQPALVVTDMKHPETHGALALWIGTGTEGYFSNLRVR